MALVIGPREIACRAARFANARTFVKFVAHVAYAFACFSRDGAPYAVAASSFAAITRIKNSRCLNRAP